MTTDIIQHHEPFNFESFYEILRLKYVGRDYGDYSTFMHTDGERHSFMGHSEHKNRIKTALDNIIVSEGALEIISQASSVMITIFHSPEAEHPLTLEEIKNLNEYIIGFPQDCETVWESVEEQNLGNEIKVLVLVTLKKSQRSLSTP